jgi:hypothetical protein
VAVTKWDTAGNIINRAASELGLGKVQDPLGSADPNFAQLAALLTSFGQDLVKKFQWQHLVTEYLLNTLAGVLIYALPADWMELIPQTGWNRTTRLPMAGPLSSQQWQGLKAWTINSAYTVAFRLNPNELWFLVAPPVGTQLAMEYRSNSWIIPNGYAQGNYNTVGVNGQSAIAVSGDVLLFDPLLLTRALKLKWKEEKGFDTTSALKDFEDTLGSVISAAFPAPTLSLNGPRAGGAQDRLISNENLPITGFGR